MLIHLMIPVKVLHRVRLNKCRKMLREIKLQIISLLRFSLSLSVCVTADQRSQALLILNENLTLKSDEKPVRMDVCCQRTPAESAVAKACADTDAASAVS